MADETIIEKAMALLPGSGAKKKRASAGAARQTQLGVIQKKLAALSKHVEKLAATIAADAKQAVSSRPAAKKPAAKKPARGQEATGEEGRSQETRCKEVGCRQAEEGLTRTARFGTARAGSW